MNNHQHQNLIWGLLCLIILIFGFAFLKKGDVPPAGVACTLEAKLCPDGSYVGRTGPSCEFAPCPPVTAVDMTGWKTFSDEMVGIAFKYPETLGTTYVSTVDWPPQVRISDESFTCTEAGIATDRAGGTTRESINGRDYCVTKVSEGAAGSTYTSYAYVRSMGGTGTAIMTFSLRMPQCANYDDPQKSACMSEQSSFAIDPIVDAMFGTLTLPE